MTMIAEGYIFPKNIDEHVLAVFDNIMLSCTRVFDLNVGIQVNFKGTTMECPGKQSDKSKFDL